MGFLYEDVEKFFGDIFACYGRFLARYPHVFIALSTLGSCLLGMGLLTLHYETDVERLYTPTGSTAYKDRDRVVVWFPDRTSSAFYHHQQIYLGTFGIMVIAAKEEGQNVFTWDAVEEVAKIYDDITEMTISTDERGIKYTDICAIREKNCVVDGEVLVQHLRENYCLHPNKSFPILIDHNGQQADIRDLASGVSVENNCLSAKAFFLAFNIRHDTQHQRDLGLLWEKKFLEYLENYQPQFVKIGWAASESLDIELTKHVGEDTKFFALTIIIMVIFATFVSSGGNWVSTRMLLAPAGILAALMAILAAFGLLSMFGIEFVDICGVMPFLVLGKGVDDMFIILSGWRQTDLKADIETRMSNTFRSSAISVTITSLTDLLAICIGATSPFLIVKNFCIYAGVAVFLCYINQLTFFAGCLVLHQHRVDANRHSISCLPAKSKDEMKQEGNHSRIEMCCCAGHPPTKAGEDDSLCEKIPHSYLPRLLLQTPSKFIISALYIVYLVISVMGASHIQTGLKLENMVPPKSYLSQYLHMENTYFENQGPPIMFTILEPVQYHKRSVQKEIRRLMNEAKTSGYLDTHFEISWIDHFVDYLHNITVHANSEDEFIQFLKLHFLDEFPIYKNDIVFNGENTAIVASRFHVASLRFQSSSTEGNMMQRMREVAANSTVPITAYCPDFIYFEHYVSILKNTLLAVGVAMIGMLFIALMFIPHPISIMCAAITMISIVIGMFGFMNFWGVALSAITTVQIILSVGFSIDYTIHISHAFLAATGKNRNERVISAITKVGVPILNGGISSILGIMMLAFAGSYLYKSFFKTMLLVIVLGLFHSLMVLPVLLSFIGPKRTNKPRMFIPISPSCRSVNPAPREPRPKFERRESVRDADSASFNFDPGSEHFGHTRHHEYHQPDFFHPSSYPFKSHKKSVSDDEEEHIELGHLGADQTKSKEIGERGQLLRSLTIEEEESDEEIVTDPLMGAEGGIPKASLEDVDIDIDTCQGQIGQDSTMHCKSSKKLKQRKSTDELPFILPEKDKKYPDDESPRNSKRTLFDLPKFKNVKNQISKTLDEKKLKPTGKFVENPFGFFKKSKSPKLESSSSLDNVDKVIKPHQRNGNAETLKNTPENNTNHKTNGEDIKDNNNPFIEKNKNQISLVRALSGSEDSNSTPTEQLRFSTELVITETSDDDKSRSEDEGHPLTFDADIPTNNINNEHDIQTC